MVRRLSINIDDDVCDHIKVLLKMYNSGSTEDVINTVIRKHVEALDEHSMNVYHLYEREYKKAL